MLRGKSFKVYSLNSIVFRDLPKLGFRSDVLLHVSEFVILTEPLVCVLAYL